MDGFDRLARDTTSSATALFSSAETLLRAARASGQETVREAARRIVLAQPSMGAMWNLAAAALAGEAVFETFVARAHRAAPGVTRAAAALLEGDVGRIVTCSRSTIVESIVTALRVPTLCAESRPALEGRGLAESLARASLPVTVVSDAAIASDLRVGDVVLVGADAIAAGWFINKVGTGQLCAAATLAGIPAYVVSGREKCVPGVVAPAMPLRGDDPRWIWDRPPAGITVTNVLFERIRFDGLAGVITDAGLLAGDMVAAVCESTVPEAAARQLAGLMQSFPGDGKAG